jgi:hypothetical protein
VVLSAMVGGLRILDGHQHGFIKGAMDISCIDRQLLLGLGLRLGLGLAQGDR